MNPIPKNTTLLKFISLLCMLLLIQPSYSEAAEDITGQWEMTTDIRGRQIFGTVTISKNTDGIFKGKWGSGELSNITFEDGKLSFVRTIRFGDQEFTMNYNGVLEDGKLEGLLSSERGESTVKGIRKKPKLPVLGQWDIHFKVEGEDLAGRLTVSQKPDGTLEGTWGIEEGEHTVSNVQFKDGKLTFHRQSKVNTFEFETTFEGTVRGNKIIGLFKNEMGQWPAKGDRIGTALIGEWELTSTSERGTRKGMMRIETDLTGRYELFGSEIPMKDLTLESDQLTFFIEMGFGDRTSKSNFKGKLDGKNLKGEMTSERGTSQIVGKKIEMLSPIVGTWEFKRKSSQGTRTSTLKINEDMTGTYAFRNTRVTISNLLVEGNEVSFRIFVAFDDRAYRMDFKGNVDGDTLKGVFSTESGSREVTGKKVK